MKFQDKIKRNMPEKYSITNDMIKEMSNLKSENLSLKKNITRLENFRQISQIEQQKLRNLQKVLEEERKNYDNTIKKQREEIMILKSKEKENLEKNQDFDDISDDLEE